MTLNSLARSLAAETWMIEETGLRRFLLRVAAIPEAALAVTPAGLKLGESSLRVENGVARIRVAGPVLKTAPWWAEYFGIEVAAVDSIREQLLAAVDEPDVKSILLDIDSPGGTVDGVAELADDIFAARDLKPIAAHASDIMASAAYWIGSQAGHITAGDTAEIGSIGVYTVVNDASRLFENAGIKTHVVASHPLKGAGVFGAPVTPAQIDDTRRLIGAIADKFSAAVARGRRMDAEAVTAVSTGQVWLGDEAEKLGLVDGIASSRAASAHAERLATPMGGVGYAAALACRIQPQTSITTAPVSASEESHMTKEEMAAQAEKLARLEAENAALRANSEAIAAKEKASLLDKHADRVMPAARGAFEALGAKMTAEDFDKYLAALPKVTRPEAVGDAPQPSVSTATPKLESGEEHLAKRWGFGAFAAKLGVKSASQAWVKLDDVVGSYSNGTVLLKDGSVVTKDQILGR